MGSYTSSRIWDSLRLLGAGLFVFTFTIGVIGLLSWLFPKTPEWLVIPVFLLAFFGSILCSLVHFHGKLISRRSLEQIHGDRLRMEQAGMLLSQTFRAHRAFQVEEFEDEGSHYFLELEDHSVLYASGQFLYEYEPSAKEPRRFPCTEFTIRRHKDEGFIVDVLCSGEVLEPEVIAPSFSPADAEKYAFMEGVQAVRGKNYEETKAERLAATRSRR